MVISGELDQQGTFNGNPLTMAAAKANLLEVLTPEAYARFDELNAILQGCDEACAKHGLPANVKLLGAKGSVEFRREPIHEYRDLWDIDDRDAAARVALAAEPRRVQVARLEVGELDDLDRPFRRRRPALRRQPRGVRRHGHEPVGLGTAQARAGSRR